MAVTETIRIIVEERGSSRTAKGIREVAREATAAEKAMMLLRRALAVVGVGFLVREYIKLSNAYTTLQNRLSIVTDSERSRIAVTRELADIASETFTALSATGDLYARIALNTRQLGIEQSHALTVTKALNQAVILSGAGTREATNGLIQLSQGLASNSLRGDELRAVLEQLPFVADIIAKKMGVARGAIRLLAFRGEIDARLVTEAFLESADEIDAMFSKLTPTIGQAWQSVRNRVMQAVGEFNMATDASGTFARSLVAIGENIEGATDLVISFTNEVSSLFSTAKDLINETFNFGETDSGFRDFTMVVAQGLDAVTGAFVGMGQVIQDIWTETWNNSIAIGQRSVNAILSLIESIINSISAAINAVFSRLTRTVNSLVDAANDASRAVGLGPMLSRIESDMGLGELDLGRVHEREFSEAGQDLAGSFARGFNMATAAQDFLSDVFRGADIRRAQREFAGRDFGALPGQPGDAKSLMDIKLIQLREEVALEESIARLGSERTVTLAEQEAIMRFQSHLRRNSIHAEDDAQRAMLAELEAMVKSNAERKIRNELDAQFRNFTRGMEDELALLQFTTQQREVESDILQVTNAYKAAGLELDAAAIEHLRTWRTTLQEAVAEERMLLAIQGDRARVAADLAAAQRLHAEGQISDVQLKRAEAALDIESRAGDPSVLAGFENGIDSLFLKITDFASMTEQTLVNAFSSAEDALVEFVTTGEFNFSKLVDSILADLTRLLARQAIAGLLGALTGGGTGFAMFASNMFGGARAEGGPVSPDKTYLVGERGPELFTPSSPGKIVPNHELGGGVSTPPQVNVSVVNVVDEDMITSALNDPRAEQMIVNIIRKNRSAVNR